MPHTTFYVLQKLPTRQQFTRSYPSLTYHLPICIYLLGTSTAISCLQLWSPAHSSRPLPHFFFLHAEAHSPCCDPPQLILQLLQRPPPTKRYRNKLPYHLTSFVLSFGVGFYGVFLNPTDSKNSHCTVLPPPLTPRPHPMHVGDRNWPRFDCASTLSTLCATPRTTATLHITVYPMELVRDAERLTTNVRLHVQRCKHARTTSYRIYAINQGSPRESGTCPT